MSGPPKPKTTSARKPAGAQPLQDRQPWLPCRADVGETHVNLQAMRNVMRNSLGHDARINENLTMLVPQLVLPSELRKGKA